MHQSVGIMRGGMSRRCCDGSKPLLVTARTANVIDHSVRHFAQVDRKFVPLLSGCQLAIMDQHAADERVKLERLHSQVVRPSVPRSISPGSPLIYPSMCP